MLKQYESSGLFSFSLKYHHSLFFASCISKWFQVRDELDVTCCFYWCFIEEAFPWGIYKKQELIMKHDSSDDECWRYYLKSITAHSDLAEEGLLTDGRFSVGAVSNKTPSHSQLLPTIKGHHMSLVLLSWQMTWLESKSATDESRVLKEGGIIAPAQRAWTSERNWWKSVATDSKIMIILE